MADSKKGIIHTYDLRRSAYKKKWHDKKERDTASTLRERFTTMRTSRQSSCPLNAASNIIEVTDPVTGGTGYASRGDGSFGDWMIHWDKCDKMAIKYRVEQGDDTNLKSPIAMSAVEAATAEFMDGRVKVLMEPTNSKDTDKVKLLEYAEDNLYYQTDMESVDILTWRECLVRGTSHRYSGEFSKKREIDVAKELSSLEGELRDGVDKKRKKEIEDTLNKRKPLVSKEEYVEYSGVGHVHIPLEDLYVDPDALCMHGLMYEAQDCFWRQHPTVDAVMEEFESSKDPFVKKENVKNVVSAQQAQDDYDDRPFFEAPEDIESESQVELLRYYNKRTNKYIVICNDMVLRDGPSPVPWLPFGRHRLIPIMNSYYGFGICQAVEGEMAEVEIWTDMAIDQGHLAIAAPVLYSTKYQEDFEEWTEYASKQKIAINKGTESWDQVYHQLQINPVGYDFERILGTLQQRATLSTGIDPLMMSAPHEDRAVRTNMMSMESTQRMIKKYIKFWAEGRIDAAYMDIAAFSRLSKDSDEDYEVRTDGKKLELIENDDGYEVDEKDTPGVWFFNLSGVDLETDSPPHIKLDLDMIAPPSKALGMQNARDAFEIVAPMIQDGSIDQPFMQVLVRDLMEKHDMSKEVIDMLNDKSGPEEIEAAMAQEEEMIKGEAVLGIPGESNDHIQTHVTKINELTTEIQTMDTEVPNIEEILATGDIVGAQAAVADIPRIQGNQEKAAKAEETVNMIKDHLMADLTPKYRPEETIQQPQGGAPPQEAPMSPDAVMGGGQMPPMAGQGQAGPPVQGAPVPPPPPGI